MRAGYTLTALPANGYTGRPPGLNKFLPGPTARHREVWVELWRTPQACAWSMDRWRWPVVADLVRCMVQAENPDTPVTLRTTIRQLRDDLGLSTAGLKQQGWGIAKPPTTGPTEGTAAAGPQPKRERRLRSVS